MLIGIADYSEKENEINLLTFHIDKRRFQSLEIKRG